MEALANGKRTLFAAVADYLHEIEITKKRKTLAAYEVALRYFLESCTKLHVEEIEGRDLKEFCAFLRDAKQQSHAQSSAFRSERITAG